MATELEWTSATELAKLIRRGQLSPVELVDALLDRIERVNPTVNAYCTVTADAGPGRREGGRGGRCAPATISGCCTASRTRSRT